MITTTIIAALLTEAGLTVATLSENIFTILVPKSTVQAGFYLNTKSGQLTTWRTGTIFELADPNFPEQIKTWIETRTTARKEIPE